MAEEKKVRRGVEDDPRDRQPRKPVELQPDPDDPKVDQTDEDDDEKGGEG